MDQDEATRYLLSFLLLLVYRAGGKMEIEHLSEIAGKTLLMDMNLKKEEDRVTLSATEQGKSKSTALPEHLKEVAKRFALDGGSRQNNDYKVNPFGNNVQVIQSRITRDDMHQLLTTALYGIAHLSQDVIFTNSQLRTEEITEWLDLMISFNPDADARTIANNIMQRMLLEVGSGKKI